MNIIKTTISSEGLVTADAVVVANATPNDFNKFRSTISDMFAGRSVTHGNDISVVKEGNQIHKFSLIKF
jgi:hypothetical protein